MSVIQNDVNINNNDDDLEDGEIDDSDNGENDADINHEHKNKVIISDNNERRQQLHEKSSPIETIDLCCDNTSPPPLKLTAKAIIQPQQVSKLKKPMPVEDDHASSIENALASVLKKKGIEPTLPKVLENRLQQQNQDDGGVGYDGNGVFGSLGQSRSSRRRKRKKQREEKEQREKTRNHNKDKKTAHTFISPPSDDDVDDYEMLNVRGGSPPPNTNLLSSSSLLSTNSQIYDNNIDDGDYKSDDDSDVTSYDSYNSEEDSNLNEKRRKRRQLKETRKRKDRRNRDDDSLITSPSSLRRQEKRARRESLDEKHRNEPRKLELCKFYLMECCAKKDKCSYMHSDFPCKYYYLGMDCVYKDNCKFAHSEPLSEELRNILLKHLETAPKEILGSFKRISRENAVTMITKRHEELCVQYNVQNIWAPFSANSLLQHPNRRSNNNSNKGLNDSPQHHQQKSSNAITTTNNIPSLLDLVIQPPINMDLDHSNNNSISNINSDEATSNNMSNTEKHRKSRWADNTDVNATASVQSSPQAAHLELKNLTTILSSEHIQKLLSMGVTNLEQVNQLTFGQLNRIGLTIAEISEIQVKAMKVSKAGNNAITGTVCATTSTTAAGGSNSPTDSQYIGVQISNAKGSNVSNCIINSISAPSTNTNGDVDMRYLTSITETPDTIQISGTVTSINNSNNNNMRVHDVSSTASTATVTTTDKSAVAERTITTSLTNVLQTVKDNNSNSNSNSNSSSGVVMVDYSQYLKDSHISFDRNDIYDDEKDDEQLVIDDPNLEHEESITHWSSSTVACDMEQKKLPETCGQAFASKIANISNELNNPFNSARPFYSQDDIKISSDAIKTNVRADDDYYDDNEISYNSSSDCHKRKSSCDSRSRSRSTSRTPPPRSQSSTPEASQSPKPFDQMRLESKEIVYERPTIYDYSARIAEEDEAKAALRLKCDKDMRILPSDSASGLSDIDLRLPFQPITNYTPATEIDGSITSHLPMTYKVYEVDMPRASYLELRQHFKSDHTPDPRLRRILGLPELSPTKTTVALSRKVRKSSHCNSSIASPSEPEDASPKYYTPPPSQHLTLNATSVTTTVIGSSDSSLSQHIRGDPRRNVASGGNGDPRRKTSGGGKANSPSSSGGLNNVMIANSSGGQKQNIEIRNLLQKSDWYKNLNSKYKIMVNQQLALVSTELKKFHQDASTNKIFDISFIVNNSTLQQILTNLGIYIDDNGEVAYVESEGDNEDDIGTLSSNNNGTSSAKTHSITLPNLSQPPPSAVGSGTGAPSDATTRGVGNGSNNATLGFLRAPPPNVVAAGPPAIPLNSMFQRPPALQVPLYGRPSLLGLPPPTHFNPFVPNIPPNASFLGPNAAVNILGAALANLPAALQQQQQRNFSTPRNQRNRRLI